MGLPKVYRVLRLNLPFFSFNDFMIINTGSIKTMGILFKVEEWIESRLGPNIFHFPADRQKYLYYQEYVRSPLHK